MPTPTSLTTHVADELRHRLMAGVIPAGARINEAELALELGISRGPIREAVRLLVSEGMLHHRTNHGAAAPTLEAEAIAAVFELRTALECHAASLAAARATADDVANLRRLCRMSNSVWREGTRFPFQLDLDFHAAVLATSGSPLIERNGALVHQRVVQLRAGISVPPGHTHSSIEDHERITSAIAAGDGAGAREAMSHHLTRVAEQLQAALHPSQSHHKE